MSEHRHEGREKVEGSERRREFIDQEGRRVATL